MDKKTLLAMALIALIVVAWPFYMEWLSPRPSHVSKPSDRAAEDSSTNLQQSTRTSAFVSDSIAEPRHVDTAKVQASDSRETIIEIRSSFYTARISNYGGGTIRQWTLAKYKDHLGNAVNFIDSLKNLDVVFFHRGQEVRLSGIPFVAASDDSVVDLAHTKKARIEFRANLANGRSVVRSLTFQDSLYSFDHTVEFLGFGDEISGDEYSVEWNGGLRSTEKDVTHEISYVKAYALLGDDKQEFDVGEEASAEASYSGATKWVATRTKYFVAYVVAGDKDGSGVRFTGTTTQENGAVVGKDHRVSLHMKFENNRIDSFKTYIGPIEFRTLNSYNENLSIILEWGWAIIRPLTKGILYTLNFLYGIIPNYGWVIVVFTFLVKIVLYPLTHKSYVGMQKMKEVMPRQKEIQKKYKGDSAKIQQEMMKLYKEIGYNPVSGCLPMLIQLPLLFPIYQVFNETIDMRQAPFFGWISDLSHPDTIYTLRTGLPLIGDFNINPLPIIMTIMTFVQQKITPMTPMGDDSDPAQRFNQKFMMYGMPIMFFFLFNNFPSGLVLYWTLFNLLTVVQQYLMSKHLIK